MLSFSGSLRVMVALEPCDMRAGFNRLQALVAEELREDVRSGTLFVFTNARRNRLKVLYWDGSGLWVLCKKLERGTFSWPRAAEAGRNKLQLAPEAFAMLTDGIDMHRASLRAWYGRE